MSLTELESTDSGSGAPGARTPPNLEGDLVGANLARTDLAGVDLTGRDLTGADLSGADLSNARLIGTCLRDAALIDTKLECAQIPRQGLTTVTIFLR